MFDITFNPYQENSDFYDEDILNLLNENCEITNFSPGEELTFPFEYPDYAYIIISGSVEMSSIAGNGREQILGILGRGASLAACPILLHDTTGTFYAKAVKPTEVYKISKKTFLSLCDSCSAFRNYIFKDISKTVYLLANNFSNVSLYTHSKTLYDLLLSSIDKNSNHDNNWYRLNKNINRDKLADLLCISKSTLQRVISILRKQGKIRVLNDEIEVKTSI